jgi:hypothetical protein
MSYNLLLATQGSSSSNNNQSTPTPSTMILLSTDGSSGKGNSVFLDSSTNNYSIAVSGTQVQSTFSPYGSTWSNFFNGSAYLTATGSLTPLQFGTNNFTIECWVNMNVVSTAGFTIIETRNSSGASGWALGLSSSANLVFVDGTTTVVTDTSTTTPSIGQWTHIAYVRNGTTGTLYVNGSSVATGTDSNSYTASSLLIGKYFGSNYYVNGYISNLRVVNGTAVYTSNFTPPSSPLTVITNTVLMTCNTNRFADQVGNFTFVNGGAPTVERFSPFKFTFSETTIGGSVLFNGSGYLTAGSSTNTITEFTGAFTVEMWVYPTTISSQGFIYNWGSGNAATSSFAISMTSSGTLGISYGVGSTNSNPANSTSVLLANQWNHIGFTRDSSNNVYYAVNGVIQKIGTISGTFNPSNAICAIGASDQSGSAITYGSIYGTTGYISDVNIVNGTCKYSANYTPPTSPITTATGTNLLLNFKNGGVIDVAGNEVVTASSAVTSTTAPPSTVGSIYFNGASYVISRNSPDFWLPPNMNWTIQTEIYVPSISTVQCIFSFSNSSSSWTTGINMNGYINAGRLQLEYANGTTSPTETYSTSTITANAWYKISYVYTASSQVLTWFIDDVSAGSATLTGFTMATTTPRLTLGRTDPAVTGTSAYFLTGYMEDFRIYRGANVT